MIGSPADAFLALTQQGALSNALQSNDEQANPDATGRLSNVLSPLAATPTDGSSTATNPSAFLDQYLSQLVRSTVSGADDTVADTAQTRTGFDVFSNPLAAMPWQGSDSAAQATQDASSPSSQVFASSQSSDWDGAVTSDQASALTTNSQADSAATSSQAPASTQDQLADVVTVFGRHEDLLKSHGGMHRDQLAAMANDASTPDDLRRAISQVMANPELWNRLETGKVHKADDKFSVKDVRALQKDPTIQHYAEQKAADYTHHYIASDTQDPNTVARSMTQNDAMRELFRYSESLPKHVNLGALQKIADGTANIGKAPPQLVAAAKFFVDHPQQWRSFTDGRDTVSRNRVCDLATWKVAVRSDEAQAIQTLQQNRSLFFGHGGLTQQKLAQLAGDSTQSDQVRQTAQLLLSDHSMLFSMLDNAKHHAGGNAWDVANDGKIGAGDLDSFLRRNPVKVSSDDADALAKESQPTDAATASSVDGDRSLSAVRDMLEGQQTAPDTKKKQGGQLKTALEIIGMVASVAVSFIPGPGMLAGLAGGVARMATFAGLRAAGTAAARGAGMAATRGAEVAATRGAESVAVRQSAKEGAKEIAKEFAEDAATDFVMNQTTNAINNKQQRAYS